MSYYLPNGSTLEFGTPGTPVSITALTNASEAVATCTNTFANGDVVYITSGWGRLDSRAVRVKAVSGTSFTMEGVDTTDTTAFPAGSGIGTAAKVATFTQLNQVESFDLSGGDQNFIDIQFLSDDVKKKVPTVKNAVEMKLTLADDQTQAWYPIAQAANTDLAPRVFRLNKKSGGKWIAAGITTMAPVPKLSINQVATVEVTACINSLPMQYAS